jgi:hypothetical protein
VLTVFNGAMNALAADAGAVELAAPVELVGSVELAAAVVELAVVEVLEPPQPASAKATAVTANTASEDLGTGKSPVGWGVEGRSCVLRAMPVRRRSTRDSSRSDCFPGVKVPSRKRSVRKHSAG